MIPFLLLFSLAYSAKEETVPIDPFPIGFDASQKNISSFGFNVTGADTSELRFVQGQTLVEGEKYENGLDVLNHITIPKFKLVNKGENHSNSSTDGDIHIDKLKAGDVLSSVLLQQKILPVSPITIEQALGSKDLFERRIRVRSEKEPFVFPSFSKPGNSTEIEGVVWRGDGSNELAEKVEKSVYCEDATSTDEALCIDKEDVPENARYYNAGGELEGFFKLTYLPIDDNSKRYQKGRALEFQSGDIDRRKAIIEARRKEEKLQQAQYGEELDNALKILQSKRFESVDLKILKTDKSPSIQFVMGKLPLTVREPFQKLRPGDSLESINGEKIGPKSFSITRTCNFGSIHVFLKKIRGTSLSGYLLSNGMKISRNDCFSFVPSPSVSFFSKDDDFALYFPLLALSTNFSSSS